MIGPQHGGVPLPRPPVVFGIGLRESENSSLTALGPGAPSTSVHTAGEYTAEARMLTFIVTHFLNKTH